VSHFVRDLSVGRKVALLTSLGLIALGAIIVRLATTLAHQGTLRAGTTVLEPTVLGLIGCAAMCSRLMRKPLVPGAFALRAAAILVLMTAPVLAADLPGPGDRVLPCRPTVACGAGIAPPGQLALEAGVQHKNLAGARVDSAPLLFLLSLSENFQVQLGTPGPTFVSGSAGPQSFLDASQVLGKFSLPLGDGMPTLGATAAVNLPTQAGVGKRTDALFALLVSQEVRGFHADLNLGLNLVAVDAQAQKQGWAALSVSHDLPFDLTGMAESWYSTAAGAAIGRDGGVLAAVSWSPRPWLCFDVGGDAAVFGGDRSFSVFVGVSTVLGNLWGGPPRPAARP
jgi:hypothetical protein